MFDRVLAHWRVNYALCLGIATLVGVQVQIYQGFRAVVNLLGVKKTL